jgi:Xaa-Pro aminopeptidase
MSAIAASRRLQRSIAIASAALQIARPGIPLASIAAAARNTIVNAGYGPGPSISSHRFSHGMGIDGHEWPDLREKQHVRLDENAQRAARHGLRQRHLTYRYIVNILNKDISL